MLKEKYIFIGLAPRVAALLIDMSLFALLLFSIKDVAIQFLALQSPLFAFLIYISVPQFFVLYLIIFHGIWGQTLGKMLLNIKIYSTTFEEIGFGTAVLRESVAFVLQLISFVGFFIAFQELPSYYGSPDSLIFGSNYVADLIAAARDRNPVRFLVISGYIMWVLSIVGTTYLSKKKRSINDKIAGTVILKTNY